MCAACDRSTPAFVWRPICPPACFSKDDGSAYYDTHSNVFVYGDNGLKSNFGGNNNRHRDNVYAYVGQCFYGNPCTSCATPSSLSRDEYSGNTQSCIQTPLPPSSHTQS